MGDYQEFNRNSIMAMSALEIEAFRKELVRNITRKERLKKRKAQQAEMKNRKMCEAELKTLKCIEILINAVNGLLQDKKKVNVRSILRYIEEDTTGLTTKHILKASFIRKVRDLNGGLNFTIQQLKQFKSMK